MSLHLHNFGEWPLAKFIHKNEPSQVHVTPIVIPTKVVTGTQTFTENTYIVFSNYGKPVKVTAPPADQVVTLEEYQAASHTAAAG